MQVVDARCWRCAHDYNFIFYKTYIVAHCGALTQRLTRVRVTVVLVSCTIHEMLETGTFPGTVFAGDMSSKPRTVPENR